MRRTRRALITAIAAATAVAASTPAAEAAFPGANGQIAFDRLLPGGSTPIDIFAIGPQGGSTTPLATNPDNDLNPSYSADGERIVFDRSDTDTIWVMNADGSGQTQLTDPATPDSANPAFSPDGTRIVFERFVGSDTEIWVMDADGQNQLPLTDNTQSDVSPSFSPDGQKIVFSRAGGSQGRIFVMDADGQNQVPLTSVIGQVDSWPDYSPDGTKIAFSRDDTGGVIDIWVMDADGQNQQPLTTDPAQELEPAFSPDGTRIAFLRGTMASAQIFTMDANGQNQAPLTEVVSMQFDTAPTWQPLNPPIVDVSAGLQKSPKHVTVTVVSNEDATATLGGTLQAPKPKPKAAASKSKQVTLEPLTVALAPGVPQTVDIAVAGKGSKLLKKSLKAGRKPKGTVTASAADSLGVTAADTADVKYKKKKKKK